VLLPMVDVAIWSTGESLTELVPVSPDESLLLEWIFIVLEIPLLIESVLVNGPASPDARGQHVLSKKWRDADLSRV
jgi:hypothetical protein